jgi:hypothetical protein
MPGSCWIVRASWLSGAALVITAVSSASAQTPAQTAVREGIARNVYITAVDDKGVAAHDLTPDEVTVKKGGSSRAVLEVRPATETMQVVMLLTIQGRASGSSARVLRASSASFNARPRSPS